MLSKTFWFVIALTVQHDTFHAYAKDPGTPLDLPELAYHSPDANELDDFRSMLSELYLDHESLDRYAYRCDGFLVNATRPEQFVSVHAVNRELHAIRHSVNRWFTDDRDPRLLVSPESSDGFGDSRISGPSVLPSKHDKLMLNGRVYFTPEDEGTPSEKLSFSGQDRNFNPVTCSVLPLTSFFRGGISKRDLSRVFNLDKATPEKIYVLGTKVVSKSRVADRHGKPLAFVAFTEFSDRLPIRFELWEITSVRKTLRFQTSTKWLKAKGVPFPSSIESTYRKKGEDDTFAAKFFWKFNADVPNHWFETKTLGSEKILQW